MLTRPDRASPKRLLFAVIVLVLDVALSVLLIVLSESTFHTFLICGGNLAFAVAIIRDIVHQVAAIRTQGK